MAAAARQIGAGDQPSSRLVRPELLALRFEAAEYHGGGTLTLRGEEYASELWNTD